MTDFWTSMSEFWDGSFWSGWVMALIIINYAAILFLFLWAPWVKIPTDTDGTTGHSWSHGKVREGLKSLPLWWLVISTIGFIAAFAYLLRYPAFGHSKGYQGWTSFNQMQERLAKNDEALVPFMDRIANTPILELSDDPQAMRHAQRLFDDNCAACHGYDAKGVPVLGAPNLTDNTWDWGGSVDAITATITRGRSGVMPGWEAQLGYGKVKNVAHYVLGLAGESHDSAAAAAGERVFNQNCVACHGADGTGNQMLGAPNLTSGEWKWGGSQEDVIATIAHGRQGHMPSWQARLSETEIHLLAAWVLSHDNTDEAIAASN